MLNIPFVSCRHQLWKYHLLLCGVACGFLLVSFPVVAAEPSIPWQCTSYTYTGSSQAECIESLSDPQQMKITELERMLKRQEIVLHELTDKLDRQTRRRNRAFSEISPSYPLVSQPSPS